MCRTLTSVFGVCRRCDCRERVGIRRAEGGIQALPEVRSPNHLPSFPHPCLLSLITVIMPRGQKSKLRAREKRRQAREELKELAGAQATAPEEEESPSSPSPSFKDVPQSSSATETPSNPQVPERVRSTTTTAAAVSNTRFDEGANNQVEERPNASQAQDTPKHWHKSHIEEKVTMLVHYLLHKYQMKEPITKADMLKNVIQVYKNHFHEILKKASDHIELVFGLDVKEVDPNRNIYVLVNKLELDYDSRVND
uniref:MAGE domain-containing protein n=1 Tax=Equus caballus TaxID=9796 RepID=A0A5F5PSK9_HORSE